MQVKKENAIGWAIRIITSCKIPSQPIKIQKFLTIAAIEFSFTQTLVVFIYDSSCTDRFLPAPENKNTIRWREILHSCTRYLSLIFNELLL